MSRNNKLYFIVSSVPTGGSFGTQVTSLILSSGTALPVAETSNNPPDPVVTAFSTFLTGSLLNVPPLSNIKRTAIISGLPQNRVDNVGNPLTGVFDPDANGGSGMLTLPGGARTVTFDGSGTEAVVPITDAGGMGSAFVPGATTVSLTRRAGNTTFTNVPTIVFPNPPGAPVLSNGATCVGGGNPGAACDRANGPVDVCTGGGTCSNFGGETAGQNVTLDSRLGQRVGNPVSQGAQADGFFLRNSTEVLIVMVDHGAAAYGVSAAGFAVTGTCSNSDTACANNGDCAGGTCTDGLVKRNVVNTTGNVNNNSFNPTPTPTKTATRTTTATGTATATRTATFTQTATNTATATATYTYTPTPVNTATSTHTHTATRTFTNTPTATPSATPTKTPFCGNGIPETPEECDDGNTVSGDCCSATCIYEAPEAPCTDDGNTCTADQCNGTGTCLHPPLPNGTNCSGPANLCMTGQQCVSGECVGGQTVNCDDNDACTVDTCDPTLGCLSEIGVETPECESCADGIDNDGDGVMDHENPNCATFFQLQRYAIIGTATDGVRSLRLGREAEVKPPTPSTSPIANQPQIVLAGACGIDMKASIGVLVTGTVALERNVRFSGGRPEIIIGHSFVNDGGSVTTGQTVPLVGPPAMCSNGVDPCSPGCPNGQQCSTRLTVNDPNNPYVDKTGTDTEFIRCTDILDAIPDIDETISALEQTAHLGEVRLRAGGSRQIDVVSGQNVIDLDAVRIGQGGNLTINGPADAVVVFRVNGAFRIGTRSNVTLTGGLAGKESSVLWWVGGAGRFVRIGSRSTFAGTLIAAKRPKISIGVFTVLKGSLIGKRIRMGRETEVIHYPFTAILEGAQVDSPNLAIRSVNLRYSSTQRATGGLRLTAIVDDRDTDFRQDVLTTSNVTFRVRSTGGGFDYAVSLSGCLARSDRVIRCKGDGGNMRATIKTLRDDPNIHNVTITRRRIDSAFTGVSRPVNPVLVTLQQTATVQRNGMINSVCRPRGQYSLSCRMP